MVRFRLVTVERMQNHAAGARHDSNSAPDDFRSGFRRLIGRRMWASRRLLNSFGGREGGDHSRCPDHPQPAACGISHCPPPGAQLVLPGTPGIPQPHHFIGRRLVQSARGASVIVDLVLLLCGWASERPGAATPVIVNSSSMAGLGVGAAQQAGFVGFRRRRFRCRSMPICSRTWTQTRPDRLQCSTGAGCWSWLTPGRPAALALTSIQRQSAISPEQLLLAD